VVLQGTTQLKHLMLAQTSYAFSRGVLHSFLWCFAPPGYYAFFPGVFRSDGVLRIFSGGVSHHRGVSHPIAGCSVFRGCFPPTGYYAFFPGVFRAAGVLHTLSGGVSIRRGVMHSLPACSASSGWYTRFADSKRSAGTFEAVGL
jgi:membrane-bound metal-dependent hydrolase YbcI (DUF457 family)